MYAMNGENRRKRERKYAFKASKECAYLAVFVALVIAVQLVLTFLPGVELVTVLFVAYSFAFGWKRGLFAATVFSLLRQLVFGFFPSVLLLYLLYYNGLCALFGILGGRVKKPTRALWWLTLVACLCTVCFTLIDDVLTPLWYGYSWEAARAYFLVSLTFMLPQVTCTALTVASLFLPLYKVFVYIKKGLRG